MCLPKKFIYSLLFFLLLYPSFPTNANEPLLNKSYAERQPLLIERFYYHSDKKDSVRYFNEIKRLRQLAIQYNDRELELETDYMKLNYLSSRGYKNYISELNQLMQKADDEHILQLQIRTRQALGFHYFYEYRYDGKALFWFLESYNFLSKIKQEDFPEKKNALLDIANMCLHTGYYQKALFYINEAQKIEFSYDKNLHLNLLNTKALIYQNSGNNEKATIELENLLKKAHNENNDIWFLIASTNLAKLYIKTKDYTNASRIVAACEKMNSDSFPNEYFEFLLVKANLLYQLDPHNTFIHFIEANLLDKNIQQLTLNSKTDYFHLLYYYYLIKNDAQQIINFANLYIEHKDSLTQIITDNSIKQAAEKHNYNRYVANKRLIEQTRYKNKRDTVIFIVAILFILATVAVVFRKRKKRIEIEKNKYIKQIEQQRVLVENAKKQIDQFIADIQQKNGVIQKLQNELSPNSIELLKQTTILTDEHWLNFKKEFSIVYPEFFININKQQQLTPSLERLAALIVLDLDSMQIGQTLGISKESVARSKRRLKAHFNLTKDNDLLQTLKKHL
ncbi:MAG TPA: hypothetical protein PKN22_02080 [Taishania sp.]|nr:hypothetical protein [Taishania sp.]HNS41520.1 hypothetical protein [Taishania sp.]